MTDDLRMSPFGARQSGPPRLYRLYELLTLPFTIYFVLGAAEVHPAYGLTAWRRFRLGLRMYRNTRQIWTGVSFRAHLAMAAALLRLPPEREGVVVECGCFRGGTTANLSLACAATGRRLFVYDSFEGLPRAADGDKYAHPGGEGFLSADLDQVRAHVDRYGAPEVCTYVKGWFADTTPNHDLPIVLMFLDVDYQASLTDCIIHLWPKLVKDGYCFIDEYVQTDYCALFWSERFWQQHFQRTPPGLTGSGSGISLGGYYVGGPSSLRKDNPYSIPASVAYTRKHWSGYWSYYPSEHGEGVGG